MDHPATLAVTLVALFVLLDVAALHWGADTRDGAHPDRTERFPAMIDPFFTEQAGRHRQAQLLAAAAHDRLLAEARRARTQSPDTAGRPRLTPALTNALCVRLRAGVALIGSALVAAGTWLQQLAGGPRVTELDTPAC